MKKTNLKDIRGNGVIEMNENEMIQALKEMDNKRVEQLSESSKKLFNAIMKIADERDLLLEENKQLKDKIDKAIEIIKSYDLGKYDYSIPPGGIIDLLDLLIGKDEEKKTCSICQEEFFEDELIDTEGMINGGVGMVCEQCLEDNDIK